MLVRCSGLLQVLQYTVFPFSRLWGLPMRTFRGCGIAGSLLPVVYQALFRF
jgi:hypothetical protein